MQAKYGKRYIALLAAAAIMMAGTTGCMSAGGSASADTSSERAGKATITASIPNNSKTYSFTVAVVTEDKVISTYKNQAMSIINGYRADAGVPALTADAEMKSVAKLRAAECATKFSHTRPDGTDYARAFPSKYLDGNWHVNENITKGYTTPQSMCRGWYGSSGHKRTMLSANYTHGNVGLYIADNGTNLLLGAGPLRRNGMVRVSPAFVPTASYS